MKKNSYTKNTKLVETPLLPTSGNIKETAWGEQYTTNLKAMHTKEGKGLCPPERSVRVSKYIVSSDYMTIINLDTVRNIFYGTEKRMLMAISVGAGNQFLATYQSEEEGKTAIRIISERLARNDVVYTPTESEVKARISMEETKAHSPTGKKAKGHGGS